MKKRTMIATLGTAGMLLGGAAFAKTSLGTYKNRNGKEVPKVEITGTVTEVKAKGRYMAEVQDVDGGTYKIFLPKVKANNLELKIGDKVTVDGIEIKNNRIMPWKLITNGKVFNFLERYSFHKHHKN